jgi:putative transposase
MHTEGIPPIHHIYNRGAHKAEIFRDHLDYERMLKLLHIANNDEGFELRKMPENVFAIERKNPLVDIVAYCLMPNHIHIALKLRNEHGNYGVSRFMQKLATGYTNYFNIKYDHSGTIWQGSYKEKIAFDEKYAQILINYIHLNPFGIKEPGITKEARLERIEDAIKYSCAYEYSSLRDYLGMNRLQSSILTYKYSPLAEV